MELSKAKEMALELMQQHCPEWKFDWSRGKRIAGVCCYQKQTIFLSKYFVELNDEDEVRCTILHEIAHTMAKGEHHNAVWKATSLKIGSDGRRTNPLTINKPKGKYTLKCPHCETEYPLYRKPKRQKACGICCRAYSNGKYDAKYLLRFIENEAQED